MKAVVLEPTYSFTTYGFAWLALIENDPAAALDWIAKAVAQGFARAYLAKDADFKQLHDNPRFRKLAGL